MGDEARCQASFGAQRGEGKAHLDHDRLTFRGAFRLDLPFAGLAAEADADTLLLSWEGGSAALELGAAAAKWAEKIRHPKRLADKFGLKPGLRVAQHGIRDEVLLAELALYDPPLDDAAYDLDVLFVMVETAQDLAVLAQCVGRLAPAGALWTIRRKGPDGIGELDVMAAGKAAGLVDVKIARVSDVLTAGKFVRPLRAR
jgi:hypothetical protein